MAQRVPSRNGPSHRENIEDLVEDLKLLRVDTKDYAKTQENMAKARDLRIKQLKNSNGTMKEVHFFYVHETFASYHKHFQIGHFRVSQDLCFKTRVGAQSLIWKSFFILMQIKLIFTRKVVHLASLWKWGFLELAVSPASIIRSLGQLSLDYIRFFDVLVAVAVEIAVVVATATIMDKSLGTHRSNPSPHPKNNVGRVYPEFFQRFNFV